MSIQPIYLQILSIITSWELKGLLSYLQQNKDYQLINMIKERIGKPICFVVTDIRIMDDQKTMTVSINSEHCRRIHRVYVWVREEAGSYYRKVGWVMREDVTHCMICSQCFFLSQNTRLLETREIRMNSYHCSACGNLVCEKCCRNRAIIDAFPDYDNLLVCDVCYYGQLPVFCIPNVTEGHSVLNQNRFSDHSNPSEDNITKIRPPELVPSLSSSGERISNETEQGNVLHKIPTSRVMIEENCFPSLLEMKEKISLKDYGPYLFVSAVRMGTLRISFPTLITLRTKQVSTNKRKMTRKKRKFIYINILTSTDIPYSSSDIHLKGDEESMSSKVVNAQNDNPSCEDLNGIDANDNFYDRDVLHESLFSMVFSLLSQSYEDAPVIDLVINDKLYEHCQSEENLQAELFLQIINGVSLLFPNVDFSKCRLETVMDDQYESIEEDEEENISSLALEPDKEDEVDRVTTDPQEPILVSIPSPKALQIFRYCYLSLTDVLLTSKSLNCTSHSPRYSTSKPYVAISSWTSKEKRRIEKNFSRLLLQLLEVRRIQQQQQKLMSRDGSSLDGRGRAISLASTVTSAISKLSKRRGLLLKPSRSLRRSPSRRLPPGKSILKPTSLALPAADRDEAVLQSEELFSALDTGKRKEKAKSWPRQLLSQSLRLKRSGIILPKRLKLKKAVTISSLMSSNTGKGFLEGDSLEIIPSSQIDLISAEQLKKAAKKDPSLLLGWQVKVLNKNQSVKGIFCISFFSFSF